MEAINQSIFTAALFLMVISVPKLVGLAIWNSYKLLLFKNLDKVTKRYLPTLLKGDVLEAMKKMSDEPEYRVTQMAKSYGDYAKDIREPIIEAITAIFLMGWLYFVYPDISIWLIASLITILVVIAVALVLLSILLKEASKIKVENKDESKLEKATS